MLRVLKVFSVLASFLLMPVTAQAFWVDNCTDEPRTVQVYYSDSSVVEVELPAGQRHYFTGIPIEVGTGTARHRILFYDDQWCVWGKNKIHLQRRMMTRRH